MGNFMRQRKRVGDGERIRRRQPKPRTQPHLVLLEVVAVAEAGTTL
jgi:hypothetical protein